MVEEIEEREATEQNPSRIELELSGDEGELFYEGEGIPRHTNYFIRLQNASLPEFYRDIKEIVLPLTEEQYLVLARAREKEEGDIRAIGGRMASRPQVKLYLKGNLEISVGTYYKKSDMPCH